MQWGDVEADPVLEVKAILPWGNPQALQEGRRPGKAHVLQSADGRNVPGLHEGGAHGHRALVLVVPVAQGFTGARPVELGVT